MEPKEWFNLRQLYRSRFSAATNRMDSKFSLKRCQQGVRMCVERAGGVVGVVGVALVLLGVVQLVAGAYFMLALPIFQLGSNLWTGAWSCLCGAAVVGLGCRRQAVRRGQVVLVATLSVLVANVANMVILQVGENGVFLSEADRRIIVKNNQEELLIIAFWLTTVVSALSIVVSFAGSQYLFCVVVRGSRLKGGMPVTRSLSEEDLQRRQVQVTRFQSPSRTPDVAANDLTVKTGRDGGGGGGGGRLVAVHGLRGDGGTGGSGGSCGSRSGGDSAAVVPQTPEDVVPYFLRNHKAAWQFILPEEVVTVAEGGEGNVQSTSELPNESYSRTSTLSRGSRSSFQPHRPTNLEPFNPSGGLSTPIFNGARKMSLPPSSRASSRPSSSCNGSLYSINESFRERSPGRRQRGKAVVRPNVPPPAPPSVPSSNNLRALAQGGWESCAVMEYPGVAGGGFVVDLD